MSVLNGKWNMVVKTYMGDMPNTADFTVNGDKLTGTVTDNANGACVPVDNGTVSGNDFGYQITIKTPVGEMTNEIRGAVNGDSITGKSKNAMGEFDLIGTRL